MSSTYLIADKNTEQLETLVFSTDGGDAVVAFTDPRIAEDYIRDAEWENDFTVATLQPIDFLDWLLQCHRSGIQLLVTDPVRADQESGRGIDVLDIEGQLKHAADHICQTASKDF